ncbi:type III pantothenate kinase [Mycoplasma sp. 6243]|uniref:type III pantothenate kinase n=1 Tax=Mycoplasma sp. 6243 TaxID=3440865 RepID=UPI003EBC7615
MLYIDFGNTLIKIGYFLNSNLIIEKLEVKLLNFDSLKEKIVQIKNKINIKSIIISSVKPEKNIILSQVFDFLKIKYKFISYLDFNENDLTFNKKITKEEVGNDILLAAYYIGQKYKSGYVVSLGTALVLSKTENKKIIGVSIMPGIKKGLNALFDNTSLVKQIKLNKDIKNIGYNTSDAVSSGVQFRILSLIMYLNYINKQNYKIIFTGGDLSYFNKEIFNNIEEEIVVKSLILFTNNKLKESI